MLGTEIDMKSVSVEYGRYSDDKLKEFEKEMQEREWGREDTAWKRACALDTKDAYEKYIAMYPNGAHRAEATKRFVDVSVEDIFKGAHNHLPGIEHIQSDDDSPTSTLVIENTTEYVLTVYYSGTESREMRLMPYSRGTIVLKNGDYKIAASVPPANIRPFAGSESFSGGQYRTGFCIVPVRN